ncbi:hypothetical protein ASD62_05315 [Phycicoccus sp. Root563]|uniref:hypothetical protein n=1 Tax=Phycicoccus sp. Root563 TaxID=1736562 RepID=UPI000702DC41|nr:hypothetical protein [Phycicoccus sp. Root563]KQZ88810.1 hypothetical protein ASD62_05315 [Phycicoccus sp. Root563]
MAPPPTPGPLPGLPRAWGVTEQEWATPLPCDEGTGPGWVRLMRGVSSSAPPEAVWPWLCMMRVAPYSYDWVDNLGRRSPRTLDPALTELRPGQVVATVFTLESFVPGQSLTMTMRTGRATAAFGDVRATYAVWPAPGGGSRIVGVMHCAPRHSALRRVSGVALDWGDLVMMRKQLRTFAALAEGATG